MSPDRRTFLKSMGAAGAVFLLWPDRSFAVPAAPSTPARNLENLDYQYRTVPIERLQELKSCIDKLRAEGKLSQQKTYKRYMKDLHYAAPKESPNARSVILVAIPWKLRCVNFKHDGKDHFVMIPGSFFSLVDDPYFAALEKQVARDVVKDPKAVLSWANPPLKALAVRTGLAEYGRNSIAYVDRYGSFHILNAYFTDRVLPDQWGRPNRGMRYCKGCSLCARNCVTNAIGPSTFLLDATRCVTLYNEVKEPMPDWIDPRAHNSLIGCMKCQFDCPANREQLRNIEVLADISEPETALLLSGKRDAKLEASISEKLKGVGEWYAKDMAYLSRNLKLALGGSYQFEVLR